MKYKLMAVDMDGTLLKGDNTISQTTEAAIKEAMAGGLKFTLCTGRPLQGVLRYVKQLQLDCPIITYNGAMIVHSGSGEVLFSQNMDSDEARKVWAIADKANAALFVWSAGELFARAPREKVAFYEEITKTTAKEIGDNCTLYQGVTLGGTGKDIGKRHPTLGNNVMVGAGAKVLGPLTIGSNSKIAANAVVLHPVPENSTAVGIPAKVVRRDGMRVRDMDQIHIPDPVAQEITRLRSDLEEHVKQEADTSENG